MSHSVDFDGYPNFVRVCESFGEGFALQLVGMPVDDREALILERCATLNHERQIRIAEAHRDGTVDIMPLDCGIPVTTRCGL